MAVSTREQRAQQKRATAKAIRNRILRFGGVALALLVWEIAGLRLPPIFLAPFHETAVAFYDLIRSGQLISATLSSMSVLFLGLVISTVLGIALGLVMGRYKMIQWILEPYVNGLYATPSISFLPLLMLWFGLDLAPKVAIVVLLAVFPILKNTFAGVSTVGQEMLEPARSMGASETQTFYKIIAPGTLPFIMAGMRLSIGRAVVGVIVGEFFTSQTGLGGLLVLFAGDFRTAEMFVPIIVLVAMGLGLTELMAYLQRKLAPWKETERDIGV